MDGICAEGGAVNSREKIVSVAALTKRMKESAKADVKVVLAFGRFDLLSRELVEQLQSARAGAAVLVVAVEPNPGADCLLPAEARAQLAAGLTAVDYVVVARREEAQAALAPAETIEVN